MTGVRLIAGSGRSGTTWVLDALARANGMRTVFEPLHPRVSAIGNRYGHRALSPDDDCAALKHFLLEVSAGRGERLWSTYRCQPGFLIPTPAELRTLAGIKSLGYRWRKFLSEAPGHTVVSMRREPLVKCIWANLMLGWLSRKCNFRIVLILRHPGAVIESRLRNAWSAKPVLERFKSDGKLHELTGGRYQRLLGFNLSPVEELAAIWLIENQYAVETASEHGIPIVFHERLWTSNASEWGRIRGALNLLHVPNTAELARPSQQTAPHDSAINASGVTSPRWERVLTLDEKRRIQAILDRARFDLYSMGDANPRELSARTTCAAGMSTAI